MNPEIDIKMTTQVMIIWVTTFIATISTVTGIAVGIRRISEFCMGVGFFILGCSFYLDDPVFTLNSFVQVFQMSSNDLIIYQIKTSD